VNGATRLHPVEWSSGVAAGQAAVLLAAQPVPNSETLTQGAPLAELQKYAALFDSWMLTALTSRNIVAYGSPIDWTL
jgi:hypothetical protein